MLHLLTVFTMERKQMSLERILAKIGVKPKIVRDNFPEIYTGFLQELLETDPKIAYLAFRLAEDKERLKALATYIAIQTGTTDAEKLERILNS